MGPTAGGHIRLQRVALLWCYTPINVFSTISYESPRYVAPSTVLASWWVSRLHNSSAPVTPQLWLLLGPLNSPSLQQLLAHAARWC
jgi:hypothetical protein